MSVLASALTALTPAIQAAHAGGTSIVPDGRTATQIQTSGATTTITTNTVSGGAGFNSFSQFKVGAGDTTNLMLPNNTGTLFNFVTGGPVVVNGILNSYKDGKIAGNVYFADPYGFIVGKSGTVNVGSLTVTTPTKEYIDSVFSGGGINAAAVNQLVNGNTPISPDGKIAIHGRINTQEGVRLIGQNIAIGSRWSLRDALLLDHASKFASSVNSKDLKTGAAIVARNGSIYIAAAGDTKIDGRLITSGQRDRSAGNIQISAGHDIKIGPNAELGARAKGAGANGGNISVQAGNDLTVQSGAKFDTSSKNGGAGNIELSAKNIANIAKIDADLSAPNGRAGTLLIDPTDLVISDVEATPGANVDLVADHSITVTSTGVIDTRWVNGSGVSTGNSGNITISAPIITVNGKLLAGVSTGSSYQAGDVSLIAMHSASRNTGHAVADAEVSVAGTITGRNITMAATAASEVKLILPDPFPETIGATDPDNPLHYGGISLFSETTARVTVALGASVKGTGSVSLLASGKESVSDPMINLLLGGIYATGAVIGQIKAAVASTVQSGAVVVAGGNISIKSVNDASMDVTSQAASGFKTTKQVQDPSVDQTVKKDAATTIAYGGSNIATASTVQPGATLVSPGNVGVVAYNTNSVSVDAVVYVANGATVGVAGALQDTATSATAWLGAGLGTRDSPVGNVTVEANDSTSTNSTSVKTIVTDKALKDPSTGLFGAVPKYEYALLGKFGIQAYQSPIAQAVGDATGKISAKLFSSKAKSDAPEITAALSLAESTHSASALIDSDHAVGSPAPVIVSLADVAVASTVIERGIGNTASSSATAQQQKPGTTDPGAKVTVSAAVAAGDYNHNATALIGPGSNITASHIGVAANTPTPLTTDLGNWNDLQATVDRVTDPLNALSQSNASAVSNSSKKEIAGSVNYYSVTNDTVAWIGSGAQIAQTSGAGNGSWQTALVDGTSFSWLAPVSVQAATNVYGIARAGGAEDATDPSATGVGASVGVSSYTDKTIAGIGDNVVINATGNVAVDTSSTQRLFSWVSNSGEGGGMAINGMAATILLDNTTSSSISNLAIVSAPSISVAAAQDMTMIAVSGSPLFNKANSTAIGLSLALLDLSGNTRAYIGENAGDISGVNDTRGAALDAGAGAGGPQGAIRTGDLNVGAVTTGGVFSVAMASNKVSDAPPKPKKSKSTDKADKATAEAAPKSPDTTSGLAISGSSGVVLTDFTTSAAISGAVIDRAANSNNVAVSVRALNNMTRMALSGGAAWAQATKAGKSSEAAIAGALAIGMTSDATAASIDNSTIRNAGSVSVQALAGGLDVFAALGVAVVSGASNAESSYTVAGSASIGIVTDSANATISNSNLSGAAGAPGSIGVVAYQTTDIGIGGGSAAFGGNGGYGAAFTYASIGNPSVGNAVNAGIYNTSADTFGALDVVATDREQIYAGAAMVAVSNFNAVAGSAIVTDIGTTTNASVGAPVDSNKTIAVSGNVTVVANGQQNSAIESVINAASVTTSNPIDFQANAAQTAADPSATINITGASIISVAGEVAVTKDAGAMVNIGASVVTNEVHQHHTAQLAQVNVTTPGNVAVAASDGTTILSIGAGVGISKGTFAGQAAVTVNDITSEVTARVGADNATPANTQVNANNVTVRADQSSQIKSFATVASYAGDAAAGIAIAYDGIGGALTAGIDGARVNVAQDVIVAANSAADISTLSIGAAYAGQVGIAGSASTNSIANSLTARIGGGADVQAGNNVGVLANNTATIEVIAGALGASKGAVGIGVSVVVNDIEDTTQAYVRNAKVDAAGANANDRLAVNNGNLASPIDIGAVSAPADATPDMTERQDLVNGIAVAATSHQATVASAVSAGASKTAAVGLTPIVNIMAGSTSATVDGSQIDTRLASAANGNAPQVAVMASSVSYAGDFAVGVAGSGSVAGGGASISNLMARTTIADVKDTTVGGASVTNVGAVKIRAAGVEDASALVVGVGAAGSVGAAASLALNIFNADTEASLEGGSVRANSLAVTADGGNGFFSAVGAGAIGGTVGVAGAVGVGISNNTTAARVGYKGGGMTALLLSGGLDIEAHNDDVFNVYSVGGAGAGSVGVAGMAAVSIVQNATTAGLYNAEVNHGVAGAGDVTVHATESIRSTQIAGSLAVGGVAGVGAAANVISIKSTVTGEIENSDVNSAGNVAVTADSSKDIRAWTVTAAAGGTAGIGASVGVILIGTNNGDPNARTSQNNELRNTDNGSQGTISSINSFTSSTPNGNGAVAAGTTGTRAPSRSTSYSVAGVLDGGDDRVAATMTGGSIRAVGVSAVATSEVSATSRQGGVGFGGGAGIGASVAYTSVYDTVVATEQSDVVAQSLTVTAKVSDGGGHAIDVFSAAGGGGLVFGGDAAIAVGTVSNVVSASVGGIVRGDGSHRDPNIAITAQDSTSTLTQTAGLAVGGVAVGASTTISSKTSTVIAAIENSSQISAYSIASNAIDSGSMSANAVAMSGGLFDAVDGAASTAKDVTTVSNTIGTGSQVVIGDGGMSATASATLNIDTIAAGVAVSAGASIGASIALATMTPTVSATVADNVSLTGTGDLTLAANSNVTGADAKAYAASGGLLLGVDATVAIANDNASVNAQVGNNVTLPGGAIVIAATNNTNQSTLSAGAAFGTIAAGVNVAISKSTTTTTARIGGNDNVNARSLSITATGEDTNTASSVAGTGGVIAGSAAFAQTSAKSNTSASAGTNPGSRPMTTSGVFTVAANHTTSVDGSVDSMQAAVVGASGSVLNHSVDSTVTATLAPNATVLAGQFTLSAVNTVEKENGFGWSVNAGAGGLINASGAASGISIAQNTLAEVGDGAFVHVTSAGSGQQTLNINAENETRVTERVKIDSAAAIAVAFASDYATETNASATVKIGNNANLLDDFGSVSINAFSNFDFDVRAVALTYGFSGAPEGLAHVDVSGANNVIIGNATTIESTWGAATVAAGADKTGKNEHVNIVTDVSMWNYALATLTGYPDAHSVLDLNSTVTIPAGSRVNTALDLNLTATRGDVQLASTGMAKDVILSEILSAVSHLFGGGDVFVGLHGGWTAQSGVGTLNVEGLAFSGLQRTKAVTIDYARASTNSCDMTQSACIQVTTLGSTAALETGSLSAAAVRIAQLRQLLANPNIDASAAAGYRAELAFLQGQAGTDVVAVTPSSDTVVVSDIEAKLGNVNVKADRLVGQGQIKVPGDASITIVNNTAASLNVNNLTINAFSDGHLRFNGALVDSNEAINSYSGGGANFSVIQTATTMNSPVPTIAIKSNYNPNDPTFFDATKIGQSGVPYYLTHQFPGPDILLNMGTAVSNLRGSVDINSASGSIYADGQLVAGTLNIIAQNGNFVQGYVAAVTHAGGDPALQIANQGPFGPATPVGNALAENGNSPFGPSTPATDAMAGPGIIANGKIYISAKFVNINSLVQSGIDQFVLALPNSPILTASGATVGVRQSDIDTLVQNYKNNNPTNCAHGGGNVMCSVTNDNGVSIRYNLTLNRLEFDAAFAVADAQSVKGQSRNRSGTYAVAGDYGNVGAAYDAINDQYTVNSTTVSGGYIQVVGQIVNTSPTVGTLRALDGFGQFNITNNTGKAVVLNMLDAGAYNNGRGTAGVIDLTDIQSYANPNHLPAVRTVFTRDLGNDGQFHVFRTTQTGAIDTTGKLIVASTSTVIDPLGTDNRNTSYNPQTGVRYNFVTQVKGTQTFVWEYDDDDGDVSIARFNYSALAANTYAKLSQYDTVVVDPASAATKLKTSSGITYGPEYEIAYLYQYGYNCYVHCFGNAYVYLFGHEFTYTRNLSAKADYPIAIQFSGLDKGVVNATSGANILVKGVINNPSGVTTIQSTNGSILDPDALVRARDVVLTAAKSIGAVTNASSAPVNVELTGGSLVATAADGPAVVAASGNLQVKTATSLGDPLQGGNWVSLSATGNITGDPNGYLIQSDRIDLAAAGSIGSTGVPLHLNVGMTSDPNMRPFGANGGAFGPYFGLSATAGRDIVITADAWGNSNADLLVNTVISTGGDVVLRSAGRMLDNNPVETQTARTYQQDLQTWTSLGLIAGTPENQARQDQAVATYQNNRTRDYQQYWLMQSHIGPGGGYQLTNGERQALVRQYQLTDPKLTTAQITQKITAFAADRAADYGRLAPIVWGYTSSYDPNFHYQMTAAEKSALLRGSSWTTRQLEFSAPPGLRDDVPADDNVLKTPNVKGHNITLIANSGLGETLAPVLIPTSVAPEDVTVQQRVALETAARSDFTLTNSLITISQQRPLNVLASGNLNLQVASGPAFVASSGDVHLGTVDVPGTFRLTAMGSINNGPGSQVSTGTEVLSAPNGGLGRTWDNGSQAWLNTPLAVTLGANATIASSSVTGSNMAVTGNAMILEMASIDDVTVTATKSIIDVNTDDSNAIRSHTSTLTSATPGDPASVVRLGRIQTDIITIDSDTLSVQNGFVNDRMNIRSQDVFGNITQGTPVTESHDFRPLRFDVTGPNGTVGRTALLNIDAPSIVFDPFRMADSTINTTHHNVDFHNGYVPGTLTLNMDPDPYSFEQVVMNNRSMAQIVGPNVQLFQPGFAFNFDHYGNNTITDTYVVAFTDGVNVWQTNYGGVSFHGPGFNRETVRDQRNGDPFEQQIVIYDYEKGKTFYYLGLNPLPLIDQNLLAHLVNFETATVPVNLQGLQTGEREP